MRLVKNLLIGALLLLIGFAIAGSLLPPEWRVERSVLVNAPPAAIYPLVANFKAGWPQWCAFDSEDPAIQYKYSGPEEGIGATRSWTSRKMGDGVQRIVKASTSTGVEFDLLMAQSGFHLTGRLRLEPSGKTTKVTWTDFGEVGANPVHRTLGALMDRMMGESFERSLSALKRKAETAAVAASAAAAAAPSAK